MAMSSTSARRIALAAQGLTAADRSTIPNRASLRRAMSHLGVLQIDAVNAVARSHLLVLGARIPGSAASMDELLHRAAYRHRELVEYWCHEACYLPAADWPLFQWRRERARNGETYGRLAALAAERPDFVAEVQRRLAVDGPMSAGQLEPGGRRGPWWGWSDTKMALEWLLWTGRVTVAHRHNFTRHYDLTERVLGAEAEGGPDEETAHRELLLRAAGHLGIGAAEDLIDYHRLPKRQARQRLRELVDDGKLTTTAVDGWDRPAYLLPDTPLRRRRSRSVLLSPFDPVVWFRPRAERLFGFRYRLEIYVPAHRRTHGYYVLPFLHRDGLRGRVDVTTDRAEGALKVHGSYLEPDTPPDTIEALALELHRLARFCGADRVVVGDRGDAAVFLNRAVGSPVLMGGGA